MKLRGLAAVERRRSGLTALTLLAVLCSASAQAVVVQVAPGGTDVAGCGSAPACASLAYALALPEVTGPGDVIEIASGTYALSAQIDVAKSGSIDNPLVIRGNGLATVLNGAGINNGSVLSISASHVTVEALSAIGSPGHAIEIIGSNITLDSVAAGDTSSNPATAVSISNADKIVLRDCVLGQTARKAVQIDGGLSIVFEGGLIERFGNAAVNITAGGDIIFLGLRIDASNALSGASAIVTDGAQSLFFGRLPDGTPNRISNVAGSAIFLAGVESATIRHTVLVNNGSCIDVAAPTTSPSTDLVLVLEHVSVVGCSVTPVFTDTQRNTSIDISNSILAFNPAGGIQLTNITHSHNLRFENGAGNEPPDPTELGVDPEFADRAGGDLHLSSLYGRYLDGVGWVMDAVQSPAIDQADPAAAHDLEPEPNGARANLGAFGNTPQASISSGGFVPDGGFSDAMQADAAEPDSAAPDSAAPDTAAPDSSSPDAASADAAEPDAAMPDSSSPDTTGADIAEPDAGRPDTATAVDGATDDSAQIDDAASGDAALILVARAGESLTLDAPADFTLDGSASTAPEGASYVWTVVDGPRGAQADPVGTGVSVDVHEELPGIWIYKLTVSADGLADSDLQVVTIRDGEVAAPCECQSASTSATTSSSAAGLLALALGLLTWTRRRDQSHRPQ